MQPFPAHGSGGSSGASLLRSALYGARSGSSTLNSGTVLYRNFNGVPHDKGILAAAVDDAFSEYLDSRVHEVSGNSCSFMFRSTIALLIWVVYNTTEVAQCATRPELKCVLARLNPVTAGA